MAEELPSQQTELELKNEFQSIHTAALRANGLMQKRKSTPLNIEEETFLKGLPALMRRGVEITRILRRTNTGPAKAKTATTRKPSKKAATQDVLNKLMEDI